MRIEPPSRASNACTWQVMPAGTSHSAIARVKKRAIDQSAGRVYVATDTVHIDDGG